MEISFNNEKGFTLIELIVVIAILGILSGIAIPRITGVQEKARYAAGETLLANMKTPLELYRVENGNYPNNSGAEENYSDLKDALTGENGFLDNMENLLPQSSDNEWYFESYSSDGDAYTLEITNPNTEQNLQMEPATGVQKVDDDS